MARQQTRNASLVQEPWASFCWAPAATGNNAAIQAAAKRVRVFIVVRTPQQERGFLTEKVPANVRPNGLPVIRQFLRFPCLRDYCSPLNDPWHGTAGPILELISRFPSFE
jgi:hypothetical protein